MAAQPASTVPTISPAEMQILISRSGLVLNPGQMADLVLAWRQVAGLIAAIPQGRPLVDDLALTFRLPPPSAAATARPTETGASGRASRHAPARVPKAASKARKTAGAARTAVKPARKAAKTAHKIAKPARDVTKPTRKTATPARVASKAANPAKARTKPKAPARGRASRGR